MFNQGNIFVGHSLALVTTITLKKEEHHGSDDRITRDIQGAILCHLERRFNKLRYARAGDDIADRFRIAHQTIEDVGTTIRTIIRERVRIARLADDVSREALEQIISRVGGNEEHGIIYILFRSQVYKKRPNYGNPRTREEADARDASLVSLLQAIEPNLHVEFFAVTDTDEGGQEGYLYHLASRVCGSMVEYEACLHTCGRQHGDDAIRCEEEMPDSVYPVRALPLLENGKRISRTVKSYEVVRKIFDLRDAVDLVCEGLDGSTNFFPPVPRGMQTIFKGEDNRTKSVAARYKFPFGVWFRGQPRICLDLTPSLYHEKRWNRVHEHCRKIECDRTMYDESTLVHHFM